MLPIIVLALLLVSASGADFRSDSSEDGDELRINALRIFGEFSNDVFSLRDLPSDDCYSIDQNEIQFYLYTKEVPYRYVMNVHDHGQSLKNSSYNIRKVTKFLIHGWLENGNTFGLQMVKNYLYAQNVDVIVMDWSKYARSCNLQSTAKVIVPTVGKALSRMMRSLVAFGAETENFHVIGFGAGAHVAGIAGKYMKPRKIDRITALDPLAPGFTDAGKWQLKYGDAKFVDVIHTGSPDLGMRKEIGNVDFYPNGGRTPQKPLAGKQNQAEQILGSHKISAEYFTESIIRRYAFEATKSHSWEKYVAGEMTGEVAMMGEYVSRNANGRYYLETNSNKPYGKSTTTTS